LGAELQKLASEMLDEIVWTNSLADNHKEAGIVKISYLFDMFKIRFRLAYEIGLINGRRFAGEQDRMDEIGKMIVGWRKWAGESSPVSNL
jgi:hypothetical protein